MNNKNSFKNNSVEQKVISVYEKSTGSKVQFFDSEFHPFNEDEDSIEKNICAFCIHGSDRNNGSGCKNNLCREMHNNAMKESSNHGEPLVYKCNLSLMFWTCPIYRDKKFYGVLRGSGYVLEDGNAVNEKSVKAFCNGKIPVKEFAERIKALPSADQKKVNSLADLLLLCAEVLSTGGDHKLLRLRSGQQACLSTLVNELKQKYSQGAEPLSYPLSKERALVVSVSRGNTEASKKILNEIFAVLLFNGKDQFRYIQLKSMELAIMLSRAEFNSVSGCAADNNVRYIKQIQESGSAEEISCVLQIMAEEITSRISSFQGIPHASAMRKAEIFIRENLHRKISLNEIAGVAGLSAPYFSSIFKNEMGENLSVYINRLRVEKACKLLRDSNHSLIQISGECCFEDQSWFSRIFKSYTGISPGKYRSQAKLNKNEFTDCILSL